VRTWLGEQKEALDHWIAEERKRERPGEESFE